MPTSFGKVQTNRALLNKYREFFSKNKQGDESFISPRPRPGTFQERYFALLKLTENSKNSAYFTKLKKYQSLTEDQYKSELEPIEFFWEA